MPPTAQKKQKTNGGFKIVTDDIEYVYTPDAIEVRLDRMEKCLERIEKRVKKMYERGKTS